MTWSAHSTTRPSKTAPSQALRALARKGTDAAKVAELKELYDKILADQEMVEWLNDTMLLEVDTMTEDDVKAHIENVKSIVEQYKDIVAG